MRYSIRYRTEYRYEGDAFDQHNALRVTPASTGTQRLERFRLTVDPSARLYGHTDYYGTEVVEFGVPARHDRLTIEADATVAVEAPSAPPESPWTNLATTEYRAGAGEFVLRGEGEPQDGALDGLSSATAADSPLEALVAVCALIPDRFEYRPGATYVGSSVTDLLEGGAGVCQDFVHLGLMLLRRQGIAARYVSGYLFAADPGGGDGSVEVNTHAWLEALLPVSGRDSVWVGADPTNRGLADARHVKIGHGREYGDVPPIKGVFRGAPLTENDVHVTMTRLDYGGVHS